ncbi:hypothetical protein [Thermus scotoductus]|uniref:Uncharacterized protein n=1 Tax=Thermus scotoductus TaxID=37636 RepID=A0A430RYA7_THESC|nr:hypothetical protein [Thermus scotoductus]RTH26024.1 hypothetical protein CSW38_06775 [Thermus scotoductus]
MEAKTQVQTQAALTHLREVLEALRERSQNLIAAIAAYTEAKIDYEAALDRLEDAKAKAIREGLEGRNEQARQAELLEKTRQEEEAVRSARAVYRVTEANLEMARVAWSLEKEVLRALTALLGDR